MDHNITIGDIIANTEVVALSLAKANSNIDHNAQDDLLTVFLDGAINDAENYTSHYLNNRTVVIGFKSWATVLSIPINPLTEIDSVTYKDVNDDAQTLPASSYALVNDRYKVNQELYFNMDDYPVLKEGDNFPITLTGKIGYTAATLPKAIQSAILLKFSHKELFREDAKAGGVDRSFNAALRPYRKW